ncbi:MAG: hypothetical protein KF708_19675 [Pirellulales bacterium]|nr:hypothetical protein [Pirellulales bacterium]
MYAYQGIVRGSTVQLPDDVDLPNGTRVLVMVPEPTGSIESLLEALAAPERCTREEVDVLDAAVNEGRVPMWALR